jgi:hypothetical protein
MAPTPVTIITGFLGSGKTTLILNLIPQLPQSYKVSDYGFPTPTHVRLRRCNVLFRGQHYIHQSPDIAFQDGIRLSFIF